MGQDLPSAVTVQQVVDRLGLMDIRDRYWTVEGWSALANERLENALEWLQHHKRHAS